MLKKLIATIFVICAIFTASRVFAQSEPPKPQQFLIQDNEFRYAYSSWYRDPFISQTTCSTVGTHTCPAQNIAKNVLEFVHVDLGNKLGDNMLDVQLMMDNTTNPVSVAYFHDSTHVGSKDFYTTFRHDIVIDRLVNRDLGVGPVKNWFVEVGADLAEKNDDFGNQRRSPMVGPGVNFKVPNGGYWKIAAMWTREWNNEGTDVTSYWYTGYNYPANAAPVVSPVSSADSPLACAGYQACVPSPRQWGQKVVYSPREVTIQTAWGVPFALGKAPMMFEGFSTLNTAKGYGAAQLLPFTGLAFAGFGSGTDVWYHMGTRPESYTHGLLMYNFGSLFEGAHDWQIGVGYEYWHNEFGVGQDAPGVPNGTYDCTSCIGNTPFITVAFHL